MLPQELYAALHNHEALRKGFIQYTGVEMEDSVGMLEMVLECIQEALVQEAGPPILDDIFGHRIRQEFDCASCGFSSDTQRPGSLQVFHVPVDVSHAEARKESDQVLGLNSKHHE